MSALVLDAGALIAIDRGDTRVLSRVERAFKSRQPVRTNAMAIAQVWRDGKGRQARLARILLGIVSTRATLATCGDCATRPAAKPW